MTIPTSPDRIAGLNVDQFDGHTAGRWNWDCGVVPPDGPDRYADIYTDDETIIARFNDCIPEGQVNARLIAAAPELLAEVIRLRAEVEASARDAARYRWLREHGDDFMDCNARGDDELIQGTDLDSEIDAALAAPHPSTAASEAAGAGE